MLIPDPSRKKLLVSMLREGGFYLQSSGNFVRHIDRIDGNDVFWHDRVGPGVCTRQTFIRNCVHEATPDEAQRLMVPRDHPPAHPTA